MRAAHEKILEFAPHTYLLAGALPMGVGEGYFANNRFFVSGQQRRMLIDAGAPDQVAETLALVAELTDLDRLDYLFLSHLDPDHTGAVAELLRRAPRLRLVGGMGNLAKGTQLLGLPADRFAVVWPGERIELGGRSLEVVAPLLEDGGTLWLADPASATLFPADAFGAALATPVPQLHRFDDPAFGQGFSLWHAINFSHLHLLDGARFAAGVDSLAGRGLRHLASVHGPLLSGSLDPVFGLLRGLPGAPPLGAVDLPPHWRLPE